MSKEFNEIINDMEKISEVVSKFSETLQPKVFDILVKSLLGHDIHLNNDESSTEQEGIEEAEDEIISASELDEKRNKPKAAKKPQSKETYSMAKDLDLSSRSNEISFKDFLKNYKKLSNIEFNTISVYYLQNFVKLPNISLDHVYTCYKNAERKVPGNLKQSIVDTASSRYGYINNTAKGITLSVAGENKVEFDLKAKEKTEE